MPVPALALLILVIADLFEKDHSAPGSLLRDAAQEALLLFPIRVLGPQRLGTSSSSVKSEVASRLDLWRRGELLELAMRAKT